MEKKIFIGYKRVKFYCGLAFINLFTNKEVQILARGRFTSRAVFIARTLQNIFSNLKVNNIETGSHTFLDNQSRQRNVSTIAITIGLSEGEYPILKNSELDLKIENGTCFINTKVGNDVLFNLPLFLIINENHVDFREFKITQKNGNILRKIPKQLLSKKVNIIKLLVFNAKEIFNRDVHKLPDPKIEDASRFIFDKMLKVSLDEQLLEKLNESIIKVQIDGVKASIKIKNLAQKNLFEINILNEIDFDEEHNVILWIEEEGFVSSNEGKIKIPSFKPKLQNRYILGSPYKLTTPELITIPVKVVASIPEITDEITGENELELSPNLIEYIRMTQGGIDEFELKAKLVHKEYVGKEIVKNISIRLPKPKLNETYVVGSNYEIKIPKDFPFQKINIIVSFINENTEFSEINQIDLSSELIDYVNKKQGLEDTITLKAKFVYGKINSDEYEKEVKILLPYPKLEFPANCILQKTREHIILIAQDSILRIKILGPDFIEIENIDFTLNNRPVQVMGSKGNFEVDLYKILKFDEINNVKCKFNFGKLVGEVVYRISRETFQVRPLQRIMAFQKFFVGITCDYSLIGEKLYFLENELNILSTNFQVELLAREPGEITTKITIGRADIPEKEISLKIFPYLFIVIEKIYNSARENFRLRLHTDQSITTQDINTTFSNIEAKGKKRKHELTMGKLELFKSRGNINIWNIEYDISDVFPSEYKIGPFSIEKNGITSKKEAQSLIIIDIDRMEVEKELFYGKPIQLAKILPKKSTTFFDEFYDKEFDKYVLRLEIVRKSPLVHRLIITNPRELHDLNKCLEKTFIYGPGKYDIRLFVKNKILSKEEITIYGVFLREKNLFVGSPCRVHIFADSEIDLEYDGISIPIERVGEYYYISEIIPKREGKIKLEVKIGGSTIFNKVLSVEPSIVEKKGISKTLEEVLENKALYGSFLVYDKNTYKFLSDSGEVFKQIREIDEGYGLKGIIFHPLSALNEVCKDVLFNFIYKLNKNDKQLKVGFISRPTLYGGPVLSQKNAEKVDFIPLVQTKCEKCGKRTMVLVKDENQLQVSCTNCETIDPEKESLQIINLPEIFRCPECGKSWLLPCFSSANSSKIVLLCPFCLTKIDYCYFTIEDFEESLPDILILSDKQTEWLRNNYTYLLEQKALVCNSCGRTHPICKVFHVEDYEITLDEVVYNWDAIRQEISGLIEERKKLRRIIRRLRQIGILNKIKESNDITILQFIKRSSLNEKINKEKITELIEMEQKISKKSKDLDNEIKNISRSFIKRFIYFLMKYLGLDKRETELVNLKRKLKKIKIQNEEWFEMVKKIAETEIEKLKQELKKLPRSKYKNMESINRVFQIKIESLTTKEQKKLIEILKKLRIITDDYRLRKDILDNLLMKSKCFYCGDKVQSLPPLSFLFIACYDSVLVSEDLLPFTVGKERFINDFYLYKPLT